MIDCVYILLGMVSKHEHKLWAIYGELSQRLRTSH